tara:strand:- start:5 stop:469 length:465 start_codon:yes stop_codon:yes gene_type:complete
MNISRIYWYIRAIFIKFRFRKLRFGKNCKFGSRTFFSTKAPIRIGDNFYCGPNCYFSAQLTVGNRVLIGGHVAIVGGDHQIDNVGIPIVGSGRGELKQTIISDDSWIGHGAIIIHGVVIGRGAVVAAGSVVTKDVPEFSVYAGNPAKLIRKRII